MASTLSGASGTDVILPEGVTTDDVKVSKEDGKTVVEITSSKTRDLEVVAQGDTELTGKSVIAPTVTVDASKGEASKIVFKTTVVKNGTIANEGKGSLEVNLDDGKFKKLTIDAGNKKRDDIVFVKDDIKLIKSTIDMGKGNDTIRFGKLPTLKGETTIDLGKGSDTIVFKARTQFKGKTTIDLGKGGKDSVGLGDGPSLAGKCPVMSHTQTSNEV